MKILILSVLLLNIFSIISAQPLKIYCIDVDQGSSTLIVSPANKYILIDAGDYETGYNYGDTVLRLIRNLGITHLDYTLATHYHADHIGGMPTVIYGLSGSGHNDSILHYCYDRADTYTTTQYIYYKNAVAGKRRTIGIVVTILFFFVAVILESIDIHNSSPAKNPSLILRTSTIFLTYLTSGSLKFGNFGNVI